MFKKKAKQKRDNGTRSRSRRAFPGGSAVKNPSANAGDAGSSPELGDPLEEDLVFFPGKSHVQRIKVGYDL